MTTIETITNEQIEKLDKEAAARGDWALCGVFARALGLAGSPKTAAINLVEDGVDVDEARRIGNMTQAQARAECVRLINA